MENAASPPVPLLVRMPVGMKQWVKDQAKKERMSANNWILRLIDRSMDAQNENAPTAATVEALN